MTCLPCARATRRRGRHRVHGCSGGFIAGSAYVSCQCPCNQPGPNFNPPSMALDSLPHRQDDQ